MDGKSKQKSLCAGRRLTSRSSFGAIFSKFIFSDKGQIKLSALALILCFLLATVALATNLPNKQKEKQLDERLDIQQLGKVHHSLRQVKDSETSKVLIKVHKDANFSTVLSSGQLKKSLDDELLFAELDGEELAALAADDSTIEVWPDLETMAHLDESVYQVGADVLWNEGLLGTDVTIAILDTGVAADHEMLSGRVIASVDFTSTSSDDGHGHGTHVAGIAAGDGQYVGVAPGAKILNVKVLNDYGYGQLSWLINGIDWAIANDADIISLSLGATYDSSPEEQLNSPEVQKIEEAVAAGVTVIIASGNCGNGCGDFIGVTTPGIAENAITIGAVDRENNHLAFSGGAMIDDFVKPDLVAPGENICSSVPWGYECYSGTSMAAPHVSGAAALLLEHDSTLSPTGIKSLLEQSALDLGVEGKDAQYGSGMLDLASVLEYTSDEEPTQPDEYQLIIPELTAGQPGTIELVFSNLYGEECTKALKALCKPRKIQVQMSVEELDYEFTSDEEKAVPIDKTKDYFLELSPLVPGKHRMHIVISEDDSVRYDFTQTIRVNPPESSVMMNPVRLMMR